MDVVDVPGLVLAMQQFDSHPAADQVSETALELVYMLTNFGFRPFRRRHAVEDNIERLVHHSSPTSNRAASATRTTSQIENRSRSVMCCKTLMFPPPTRLETALALTSEPSGRCPRMLRTGLLRSRDHFAMGKMRRGRAALWGG